MTDRHSRRKGHDNVAHLCPICWRPARRVAEVRSVSCAAGHVSCMRCGRQHCACASLSPVKVTSPG